LAEKEGGGGGGPPPPPPPPPPAPARDLHKRAGAIPKVKWLDPDNLETA
jgi:hypothetical protein